MKVSLSWLKEYIHVDLEPSVMAKKLTMAGLEVDAVEERYDYLNNIVVAKVNEVKKHPNADKLSVCMVDAGGDELIQIVCGAPNVREGMVVPCALPGTVLPGDFKIKKGKLRGEVSAGMLCSASELKLNTDSAGIMDLEGDFVAGTPLDEALNVSDTVFEIDLTPNRPDCLSIIGVAREVGAFTEPKQTVRFPDFMLPESKIGYESIHDYAKVQIIDPDLCPRYSAGLLFDVTIEPSPFWLQERLESIGLTPINNVVDITNFVMMEMGQPLHAFDFDEVAKGKIIIRRAGSDTNFTTLDSKDHKLESDMLMICDGKRPVALAGVMGGENSEISNSTTRVLVESAYFNPISIRKTAKKTGIASDASHRFERGVDPDGTVKALNRAVSLMAQICDATIAKDIIDEHPNKPVPLELDLNTNALNTRLGTNLSTDAIGEILTSVEFKVEKTDDILLKVGVPFFRVDVIRPEDLSEEVARLWGYNNIQTSYPLVPAKGKLLDEKISFREKIRQIMTGFSFSEVINYNFINENSCDRLNLLDNDKRRYVETILNPISDQMSVLRSSLIPGLLETMKRNISQQSDTLKFFEIGKIFFATQKGSLPEEKEMIAGLITGNRSDSSWCSKKTKVDFFDLKGAVEGFFEALMIENIVFGKIEDESCLYYKDGYAAYVKSGDTLMGTLGKIEEKVLKNYGLKQDAFIFDFSFNAIQDLLPKVVTAESLPKFPSISRDITIIVDRTVTVGAILKQIELISKKEVLIENVFLFDVFEGQPLSEDKKSLSFRVVYRSTSKTLKEKNIKKLHVNISKIILDQFNADLPE
ncbi:phenylalanine--tRNA ligase subunit beta [Desulfobacula sp.]|uniref:phenylalanine--tRNA ligase subunit beta n=1 Tax=Desulfobacula sp. TaxID=2593537 RepID=UPI0025C01836|nr:phenylalanine--tRNA ligase subunit beta [Desulfobacula sp.]MBC2705735.1 phenylalanine--tRNA ligase subunit beta [Desulfobacula sp.]